MTAGCLHHPLRLGRVEAHARFGEDVLAGCQRRQRDRAVQVRPGADDDSVHVAVGDHLFPVGIGARDVEGARCGLGRFGPAVAHGDDVHVGDGPEARNVSSARVGPGSDQPDTQRLICHDLLGKKTTIARRLARRGMPLLFYEGPRPTAPG